MNSIILKRYQSIYLSAIPVVKSVHLNFNLYSDSFPFIDCHPYETRPRSCLFFIGFIWLDPYSTLFCTPVSGLVSVNTSLPSTSCAPALSDGVKENDCECGESYGWGCSSLSVWSHFLGCLPPTHATLWANVKCSPPTSDSSNKATVRWILICRGHI